MCNVWCLLQFLFVARLRFYRREVEEVGGMKQKKKHTKVVRAAFTRTANEFEQLLVTLSELVQLQVFYELLQENYADLKLSDNEMMKQCCLLI